MTRQKYISSQHRRTLIKKLEKLGWISTDYWKTNRWISPHTKIDYTFIQALVISDFKLRKTLIYDC